MAEDAERIRIVSSALEASIRKKGYVTGVEAQSLLDKQTGSRFGLWAGHRRCTTAFARFGDIAMRAQCELPSALRADTPTLVALVDVTRS